MLRRYPLGRLLIFAYLLGLHLLVYLLLHRLQVRLSLVRLRPACLVRPSALHLLCTAVHLLLHRLAV